MPSCADARGGEFGDVVEDVVARTFFGSGRVSCGVLSLVWLPAHSMEQRPPENKRGDKGTRLTF
jgi:hypothetical protein